jgi:hypothetical protein
MSKVKNMIALQALIEEKRRTGFASDIAAANEADAVLDTIHKEIIRLEAIEAERDALREALQGRATMAHALARKVAQLQGGENPDHTGSFDTCPAHSCRTTRALLDRKP